MFVNTQDEQLRLKISEQKGKWKNRSLNCMCECKGVSWLHVFV